ncbi:MAG: Diaminopimelate epimerase [Planctomycetes bacterium ADurb.Bin126]|nr:MAG: Diaminopimelate epimerase [Planctomycetes bacterium ADurb.Bin126]HOD84100.1 diaminopimelate epimerase [Phycisphaerae bacterium]HQL75322.1 diaminopimelate epimerase [Phycisphaerae bacterium]
MRFTKMHGIGNDYVYVNALEERVDDPAGLARLVSDRHFGIGSDGLILILGDAQADVRMRMFNADGSEGQMCGNGIRCVAKYAWDRGLARNNPMRVATAAGVKTIQLEIGPDDKVALASVDMGEPILGGRAIPVALDADRVIDQPIEALGRSLRMTCVSMGNPHAVFYVDDAAAVDLERIGPAIENHPLFPQRVNAHFVQVHSPTEATMRTWERGSGITLACGTGASAVCVAGVLTGRTDRSLLAHLPGGDLRLEWRQSDNHVIMTGPAAEVYQGVWPD